AVAGPVEGKPRWGLAQLDVMPGGQRVGLQLARGGKQLLELDVLVAGHAGNRRLARNIAVCERLNHTRLKALLVVQHVVGDAELVGNAARIVDVLPRTAGPALAHGGAMVVEL